MTMKSLGNAVPTADERQKMFEVLEGLRQRLNARGSTFGPPTYIEADDTVELRWEEGGRAWVTAWVYDSFKSRTLMVWRHPSYRYNSDEQYLYEARI